MKHLYILAIVATITTINSHAQTWDEIQKIVPSDRTTGDLNTRSALAIHKHFTVTGATKQDLDASGSNNMTDAGAIYVWKRDATSTWTEQQKLTPSDRAANDQFGYRVDITDGQLISGCIFQDTDGSGSNYLSNAGAAYIFSQQPSGNWAESKKLIASDREAGANFGTSVNMTDNYVIVGAVYESKDAIAANPLSEAGAAYIFQNNMGEGWTEIQKLVASDRTTTDHFGFVVDISDKYAIAGTNLQDTDENGINPLANAGAAYIFERDGAGDWNETAKLVASDRKAGDFFGHSVKLLGDYAFVSALLQDEDIALGSSMTDAGAVYVFERDMSGNWNEVQKLVPSDREAGAWFGLELDATETYLAVGASRESKDEAGGSSLTRAGAAYIFRQDASNNWIEMQKIVTSDRESDDEFGYGVAISGSFIASGAPKEDEDEADINTLPDAGSAYIYQICDNTSAGVTEEMDILTADEEVAFYQWFDCSTSQAIPGETNQSFSPTTSGSYSVEVTIGNCVSTSSCSAINVGIDDHQNNNLKVFAANGFLHLQIPHSTEVQRVEIYSLDGRSTGITSFSANKISLHDLAAGGYLAMIKTSTGVQHKKFVKS